ncbi:hypothetical protein [Rubrivirga sp.]|uniref:hypothetical protein n=1 Tax=Rubrivirga sp. TaxID=1885344 RepID=UPI003C76A4B9
MSLRAAAFAVAGLVLVVGAAFPAVAATRVGLSPSWALVLEGGLAASAPALGLVVVARQARSRLSSWAAVVGSLLTLGLGLALYIAALRARPGAAVLAVSFVPLRQLVAVAFCGWAVWITRSL